MRSNIRYYFLVSISIILLFNFRGFAKNGTSDNPPFRIGINFPFRSQEVGSLQMFLQLLGDLGAKGIRQLTFGDVFWGKVEPEDNQWDFTNSDSVLFNSFNIYAVPTLFMMGTSVNSTGLQVPWRACTNPGCGWNVERDSADTRDYVQTVVKRYMNRTHYWEIANEMDGHTKRPEGLPVDEFAQFMVLNYQWIKAVDPNAKILLPGLLGTYGLPLSNTRQWLKDLLSNGGGEGFDILNYHDYNAWWTLAAHYDSMKAILKEYGYEDKPIWVTECSISSDPTVTITPNYAGVDEQAADVWRRSAVLFAKGVQTWFWHSFWSSGGQSEWREFGILDANGNPKKSYYSYKLLLEKINGFQNAEAISFGNATDDNSAGGEGVWVVKFNWADGTSRWVMWSPDNQPFDFKIPINAKVTLTKVVPTAIHNQNNQAEFDSMSIVVQDTILTIQLTGQPVLVEITPPTSIAYSKYGPSSFTLHQNYPNPFNPETFIPFTLIKAAKITLTIFNNKGEKVRTLLKDQWLNAGKHIVRWDGKDKKGQIVPSGIYYYRIKRGKLSATRNMVLLR